MIVFTYSLNSQFNSYNLKFVEGYSSILTQEPYLGKYLIIIWPIINCIDLLKKEMLRVKEKSYNLLLIAAIGLLVTFVIYPITTRDPQEVLMFSVPLTIWVWTLPAILISLWFLYLLTSRFIYSKALALIHVLLTALTLLFIVIGMYVGINPTPSSTVRHALIGNSMQILFIVLVTGQFTYFINILLGLYLKGKDMQSQASKRSFSNS